MVGDLDTKIYVHESSPTAPRPLTTLSCRRAKVVDDLLESMLDGWVFGERQAEHAVGGFVPGVKTSGALRPGDQRRAVVYLEHR